MTGCFFCGNAGSNLSSDLPRLPRPCTLSAGGQCLACEKLVEIDFKIRQMHAQLTDLLKQRHELLPEVNQVHNPVILSVPPELSSMIFELCVPKKPLKTEVCEKTGREEVKAPLVLGSICRGWRELAWSMPRLWTCIDVRLDKVYDREEEISVSSEWFSRSHTLPLSIHVSSNGGFQFSQSLKEFIRVINRNYHRWETLDVCTPPNLLQHFVGGTRSKTKPLPILRSLRLCMNSHWGGKHKFIMKNVLPTPTEVALRLISFHSVSIDWSQITRLRVGSMDVDDCVAIFKLAKALEFCKISDITGWGGRRLSSSKPLNITLPFLRELELNVNSTDNASVLSVSLTLPALVSLVVKTGTLPIGDLIMLIRRSSCQLRRLSLVQMTNERVELSPLLREVPSLEHLSYETHTHFASQKIVEFLNDLTPNPNTDGQIDNVGTAAPGLLPNLLSLVVDVQHLTADWDQLKKLIRLLCDKENSRKQPLRRLHLGEYQDGSPPSMLSRGAAFFFLSFAKAGVDLKCIGKYQQKSDRVDLLRMAENHYGITDADVEQYRLNLKGVIS